ncbi:MAG: hypothetical protein LEGION0403_FIIPPAGN_02541 [Legionella sp.]|uniref:hypothetical protein n=1 Tax=Legionella sp. TaxID=459 RepID=UPI003D124446
MGKHNEERPLAYIKAREIPTEEFKNISGGSNKLTTQKVRRKTNFPPGYDEVDDVVFD